jgi:hypothetical protein
MPTTHPRSGAWILAALSLVVLAPAARATEPQQPWFQFSRVMSQLSRNQEFIQALVERIGTDPRAGGILGPEHVQRFREIVLGKQFEALDSFPTMTVREMGQAVSLAATAMSPPKHSETAATSLPPERAPVEPLGIPSGAGAPADDAYLKVLGFDLAVGDRIDAARGPQFGDATRLAEVMNRLARNVPGEPSVYTVTVGASATRYPEQLLTLLTSYGHSVEVRDARYFANFGDLIYEGRDVLTPFWLDTEIMVPGQDRTLRVPASHSQHELGVRGPTVNADLAFFFGIDGLAELRPIVTKDQAWTYGHVARTYTGPDALEVVRFMGSIIRTYDRVKREHPDLPFGGYYALGVCNDVNAMIEMHMQGETTLFPLTHDPGLFTGHGEVDNVVQRLPVDGRDAAARPDPRRVLGSLPVGELSSLALPHLRHDLAIVKAAFDRGTVTYAQSSPWRLWARIVSLAAFTLVWMKPFAVAGVVMLLIAMVWVWRRATQRRAG